MISSARRLIGKKHVLHVTAIVALLAMAAWWTMAGRCASRWDVAIGRPGFDEPVRALTFFDGELIAGGMFLQADGQPASRLARWNGENWSGIRSSLPLGPVRTLHVFDDGRGDALAVAGQFQRVARWDGAVWSFLGNAFDDWVLALTTFDDGNGMALYAGGRFNAVMRWDGQSWVQLGDTFDGPIHVLGAFRGSLFAGGAFSGGLARWDGLQWTIVDQGVDGFVNTMVVSYTQAGELLYVGGRFSQAGGAAAAHFAVWDGSSWTAPADGPDGEVQSLATSGSLLFLGGSFTQAGSVQVNRIAQWDGERFLPLGRGTDERVHALLASAPDEQGWISLYVGGIFENAGGRAAHAIAIWRTCER